MELQSDPQSCGNCFFSVMIFDSLKLYANPKGIPKKKLQLVLKRFTDNGGTLVELIESNIVLSAGPFEAPHGIIIDSNFISDSILNGKLLPLPPARIIESPKKRVKLEDLRPDTVPFPKQRVQLCMQSSPLSKTENGHNKLILEQLKKLLDRYTAQGDRWRIFSYRKAIKAIEANKQAIHSGKEAFLIPGVGQKIADKIDEIIATGRLAKNDMVPEE